MAFVVYENRFFDRYDDRYGSTGCFVQSVFGRIGQTASQTRPARADCIDPGSVTSASAATVASAVQAQAEKERM